MEYRCPHCGKSIQVSDEELALHGNTVVCPQCLSVFEVDSVPLTVDEALRRRKQSGAQAAGTRFCPACGGQLQTGMNFCPHCGMRLQTRAATPYVPAVGSADAAVSLEPARDKKEVAEQEGKDDENTFHIPFMPYRFNMDFGALFPKPKASRRAQAVGYTLILLLLVLLGGIIIAAYKL